MARYQITGPDGKNYEINAPEDASEHDVLAFMQQEISNPQPPDVSQAESLGRGAVQGVTFGFGDEIYGAAKGAYDKVIGSGDFSGTYAKERDAVRTANDRAQEANPTSYFAGELGGGVALPFGFARAGVKGAQLANAGLKARSMAAAKEGAVYGAAYGLGNGEGDVGDQALSTIGGAIGGGAVGGRYRGQFSLAVRRFVCRRKWRAWRPIRRVSRRKRWRNPLLVMRAAKVCERVTQCLEPPAIWPPIGPTATRV